MVKSWTDKLNAAEEPKLKPSLRTSSDVTEGDFILVPTARQVDEFMRGGRLTSGTGFVRQRRSEEGLPE
jgi:hypothetical protein